MSAFCKPQWLVDGVGTAHPCLDRVLIYSPRSLDLLNTLLPIHRLKERTHDFRLRTPKNKYRRRSSRISLTCAGNWDPLLVLQAHVRALGRYSITEVEIAYDFHAKDLEDAKKLLLVFACQLAKERHHRRFVWSKHDPDKKPRAGCVSAPTLYLERSIASVKLKCYARHAKLARGNFAPEIVVRVEWTLKGKAALARHLGGNQIKHLLRADLNAFFAKNMRLERVNHLALARLLSKPPRAAQEAGSAAAQRIRQLNPHYWAARAAWSALRKLAHREYERGRFGSWKQALRICQNSPAQIRGYLRELRDGARPKRGRPKINVRPLRKPITTYRIDRCFTPIELLPVEHPPYNNSSLSKISHQKTASIKQFRRIIPISASGNKDSKPNES